MIALCFPAGRDCFERYFPATPGPTCRMKKGAFAPCRGPAKAAPSAPSRDRDQRVACGAVPQHMDAGIAEAGAFKVEPHQGSMSAVVERLPDGHRLGRKAAVGEADDKTRTWPKNSQNLGEHLHRMLEVLDPDTAQGGIAALGY